MQYGENDDQLVDVVSYCKEVESHQIQLEVQGDVDQTNHEDMDPEGYHEQISYSDFSTKEVQMQTPIQWKKRQRFGSDTGNGCFQKYLRSSVKHSSKNTGASISCSYGAEMDPLVPSSTQVVDAKVLYCVAPAMGHNQESHTECHLRVPSIVSALDKMELTPKFHGSEIFELQNFTPASVDDIASVHTKAYVSGFEKAMDRASEQGLIFIEGSGPTYATATTFQESLVAAGAGISLVDSVVMSQSST